MLVMTTRLVGEGGEVAFHWLKHSCAMHPEFYGFFTCWPEREKEMPMTVEKDLLEGDGGRFGGG